MTGSRSSSMEAGRMEKDSSEDELSLLHEPATKSTGVKRKTPSAALDVDKRRKTSSSPSSTRSTSPREETPPPSAPTRSQRKRAAPRIKQLDQDVGEAPSKRPEPKTVATRKKQPLRGNWSVDHLMQSEKSKLATVDLEKLLLHPKAWSSLTVEEQRKLASMLPNTSLPEVSDGLPMPNVAATFIKAHPSFRPAMRLWQEELAAGHYEPKWLEDASNAMERRADGKFDEWKEQEMEQFWGQKQRVVWRALAGESAQHSLQDLVKGNCFQVGDVWLFRRGMRVDKRTRYVEKEATITAIAENHTLAFAFPPGQCKHSSPANGPDKTVEGVAMVPAIAQAICTEDGRIPADHRAGNAWKDFRCLRKNQDIGALWDIRELYHSRLKAS